DRAEGPDRESARVGREERKEVDRRIRGEFEEQRSEDEAEGHEDVEIVPFDDRPRRRRGHDESHATTSYARETVRCRPHSRRHSVREPGTHLIAGCLQTTTRVSSRVPGALASRAWPPSRWARYYHRDSLPSLTWKGSTATCRPDKGSVRGERPWSSLAQRLTAC